MKNVQFNDKINTVIFKKTDPVIKLNEQHVYIKIDDSINNTAQNKQQATYCNSKWLFRHSINIIIVIMIIVIIGYLLYSHIKW